VGVADYDKVIAKINATLHAWNEVKRAHGITPETIEAGSKILVEAKLTSTES
jgi:hypothetical protein